MDRSKVGAIVRDVKNLVSNALVSFVYIRRGCNEAAHVMTKLADNLSDSTWCHEVPDAIRAILCNEQFT